MIATLQSRTAVVAVAMVFLTACAQAPHRPLEAAQHGVTRTTDVVAIVPQQELVAQIVVADSTAVSAQFGLIGALVGSAIDASVNASRASTADAAVRPLRDALLGYDFDAQLKQELERQLAGIGWLGARAVKVSKQADVASREAALRDSTAGGVLYVQTAYELSPDFSTLILVAQPSLFPPAAPAAAGSRKKNRSAKGPAPTDPQNALYYNTIRIEAALDAKGALEQNRAKWGENAGDLLRRSLQFQVAEAARLLAIDLQYVPPPTKPAGQQAMESGETAQAVRNADGTLKSVVALARLPAIVATPAAGIAAAEPQSAPVGSPDVPPAAAAAPTPSPGP